mgnify:FL=1
MIKFLSNKFIPNFPEFNGSNWLIRFPLAIIFIQQGLDKLPFNSSAAEIYGLSPLVWIMVIVSELLAGIGLLFGGVLRLFGFLVWFGDLLTRFSGSIIVAIILGVIIISKPDSLLEIILYDHIHVMLCCGGLFFALRGNRVK